VHDLTLHQWTQVPQCERCGAPTASIQFGSGVFSISSAVGRGNHFQFFPATALRSVCFSTPHRLAICGNVPIGPFITEDAGFMHLLCGKPSVVAFLAFLYRWFHCTSTKSQ
jgi:hypothetical protein